MGKRIIRPIKNQQELKLALDWAAEEGWNPGRYDDAAYYAASNTGYFVIEEDGEIMGSVAAIQYTEQFGFGGLFIVLPQYRHRKAGDALASFAIQKISESDVAGCNAVYPQVSYYKTFGFKEGWNNLRCAIDAPTQPYPVDENMRLMQDEFEKLVQYDASIFGSRRAEFLQALIQAKDTSCLVSYNAQREIIGYGIVRRCQTGYRVGPLYTDDFHAAKSIFEQLLYCVLGERVILDIPEVNQYSRNFIEYFHLTRDKSSDTLAMFKFKQTSGVSTLQTPGLEKRYALGSLEIGDGLPSGQGYAAIQEKEKNGQRAKL